MLLKLVVPHRFKEPKLSTFNLKPKCSNEQCLSCKGLQTGNALSIQRTLNFKP